MKTNLTILASGMVSSVGFSAAACCAAIRCQLDNVEESGFWVEGQWLLAAKVPTDSEEEKVGAEKLKWLLTLALEDCIDNAKQYTPDIDLAKTPLLLCLPEASRPDFTEELGHRLFEVFNEHYQIPFHEESLIIYEGSTSIVTAMEQAQRILRKASVKQIIIAGVDSLVSPNAIAAFAKNKQILTDKHSDGFIPGEAASAVLVTSVDSTDNPQLYCSGTGLAEEPFDTQQLRQKNEQQNGQQETSEPLMAKGLIQATRTALDGAGARLYDMDFRMTDISGQQQHFKESSIATTHLLHTKKSEFDLLHPADCIGEVGAAIGPVLITVLLDGVKKGYLPGDQMIVQLSNPDGLRGAMVMHWGPLAQREDNTISQEDSTHG